MGFLVFAGERLAIRAGRPAFDVSLLIPRMAGCGLPGPIIRHRAFNREEAPIMVGDNQEERHSWASIGHGVSYAIMRPAATLSFGG